MNEKELKQRIKASNFIKTNGKVLATLNILSTKYTRLNSVATVFKDITESEFIESINFLTEEDYINLRHTETREKVILADTDIEVIEAKLSGKGLRLLNGGIEDNMIEV